MASSAEKMAMFLVAVCCCIPVFGQKEAGIWYFGEYAGLDFAAGSPVYLLNSAMNKDEGCSSVSDGSGNLLFHFSGQISGTGKLTEGIFVLFPVVCPMVVRMVCSAFLRRWATLFTTFAK